MMHDVIRLKDHPSLFMWGLGNELNLRELLEWAKEEQILVYIFEAFDENWK